MVFERDIDTNRAGLHRIYLEGVCGKHSREGLEHVITGKALWNIHKNWFIAEHK